MNERVFDLIKERIDRNQPIPVYYQLACEFERLIKNKALQPGEKLPGDLFLSENLQVNYRTLKKVFSHLEEKGLVQTRKNVGTFVASNLSLETPTIGFFYLREAEYYMAKRGEFMHSCFSAAAFDLKIIPYAKMDFFTEVNLHDEIRKKGLAGAVVVPAPTDACRDSLLELERNNFPYVRLGRSFFTGQLRAPLVRGNDTKRTEDALKYLWGLGHRNIGLITSLKGDESERSYREFYEKRRCPERWIASVEFTGPAERWDRVAGIRFAGNYVGDNPDVTAIVGGVPGIIDFTRVLSSRGKSVPKDVSLLCLGDWAGLLAAVPAITGMTLSDRAMGETAAALLLEVMQRGYEETEKIVRIDYELVERESVSKCTNGKRRKP